MKKILCLFLSLVASVATAGEPGTLFERYVYTQCGRDYYGYRPVSAPTQVLPATAAAQSAPTDNSVSYTYNINYGQLPVAQGSTLYGYSSVANTYGNTDLGALYNMAIRLASDQAAISDKAHSGALSLIAQEQRSRAKVAEILATGQVLSQANAANVALAQALAAKPAVSVETTVHGAVTTAPQPVAGPIPAAGLQPANALSLQGVFNKHCVTCHKPGAEKSGLDLSVAASLDVNTIEKIKGRIITLDPAKRMPPPSAKDVQPLSTEEVSVVFAAANN